MSTLYLILLLLFMFYILIWDLHRRYTLAIEEMDTR